MALTICAIATLHAPQRRALRSLRAALMTNVTLTAHFGRRSPNILL